MSLTRAGYTKDWNNPSDFPTIETSETQVRLDIQDLYDQIRDDVNVIAGELESTTSGSSGASNIGTSLISGVSGTNVQAMLADLKSQINGAIADAYTKAQADAKFETIVAANNLINNVTFDSSNGKFTFTFQDVTKTPLVIDTNLELIPGYITLVEDPVGSGTYYMAIYTKDPAQGGILISRCPVSALFNPIAVQDTTTIDLTLSSAVAGVKTLSASVKTGSIGEEHLTTEYKSTLQGLVDEAEGYKDDAEAAATNSANSATESSGYATTALGHANTALGYATNAGNSATAASNSATSASGYATNASNSANQSSGYATTSQQKATLSESYAKGGTGTRTGEDTDNSKYYKEQAAAIVDQAGIMKKADYDSTAAVLTAGGIVPYVEVNGGKIDEIQVNGITQPIVNKVVNLPAGVQIDPQTTQEGDVWIDTDGEEGTGTVVTKVNNLYGDVTVTPALIGAVPTTTTVNGQALSQNIVVGSNRNLLDNGWFTINQRGATSFGGGYGVDRWTGSSGLTISGSRITNSAESGRSLWQKLDPSLKTELNGKTITVSARVNGTIRYGTAIYQSNPSSDITLYNNDECRIYIEASYGNVNCSLMPNNYADCMKLELGSVSTLANDVAPDTASELAKCQRYYYCTDKNITKGAYASNSFYNANYLISNVRFPVEMRTTPTVTVYSLSNHTVNKISYWTNGADVSGNATVNTSTLSSKGFNAIYNDSAMDMNTLYAFHYEATADL